MMVAFHGSEKRFEKFDLTNLTSIFRYAKQIIENTKISLTIRIYSLFLILLQEYN